MFQLLRFFPLGGWGGPEKDQILRHCLIHGLAIIRHLVQVLLRGMFQGQGQVSLAVVRFSWSGILSWCEVVPSWHFINIMTLLFTSSSEYPGYIGKLCAIRRVLAWLCRLWASDFSWFCCMFFFYPFAFLSRALLLFCSFLSLSVLSTTDTVFPFSRHHPLNCTK